MALRRHSDRPRAHDGPPWRSPFSGSRGPPPSPAASSAPARDDPAAATVLASASASLSSGHGPAFGSPWELRGDRGGSHGPVHRRAHRASGGRVRRHLAARRLRSISGLMAYDAADRYAVLLQSNAGSNSPGTWTYSNGEWSLLNLSSEPASCPGGALAYDSTGAELVFLGSASCGSGNGSGNQTWTFSAGVWTRLSPATTPGSGGTPPSPTTRPSPGSSCSAGRSAATAPARTMRSLGRTSSPAGPGPTSRPRSPEPLRPRSAGAPRTTLRTATF